MRKISKQAAEAFMEGRDFRSKNTTVEPGEMRLHGNLIARKTLAAVEINFQGWVTLTTKERINAVASHVTSMYPYSTQYHIKNGELFRNDGKPIPSAGWVRI